ncbi:MAG: permease YjgP/YjgQ family protein [Ignavibacteria bacterium]|nr:MAG: permease YjgP/YjgQ family protein [Ignavibacteria bacterium]KAF0161177.1 MAG: permease YjgP/YjgQ family protein [Ignavibacteria bacterium]
MKVADKLVGKGLGTWVIIKLIGLSLGYILVLVIPMAVLVATLMAFGNMSQNNEVTILKATGISMYKMIIPPLIASIFVAVGLVYFNNNIYPDANHALRILQEDITRKKPTLSLVPGVFSQEVANYAILVREINQTTNELKQITIYDYSSPPKVNIVTAEEGKIYFTPTQKKLIMDLKNGEIHESDNYEQDVYRKLRFAHHKIAMPAEQFTFEQSAPGGPRGDREIGAPEMQVIVDSLKKIQQTYYTEFKKKISSITNLDSNSLPVNESGNLYVYVKVEERLRSNQATISDVLSRIEYNRKEINRYLVEIHKKYALPVACIVFVLIGAPLGTMTRKGGIGMAAGISLFFFIIYWAFLIGGEKLADRDLLSPFIAIWSANFVLGIFGIAILVKTAREKVTLSFDFVTKYIPQSWKAQEDKDENS